MTDPSTGGDRADSFSIIIVSHIAERGTFLRAGDGGGGGGTFFSPADGEGRGR
jgi:hypothetical protein